MNERITPPDWDSLDPMMLINVDDMKYYYENFTEVTNEIATENQLAVGTLDGRVTALEQSTPVGPGGKGAYLNLGGTPERYPTAEEMVEGDTAEPTSFLVVARNDGIYFYNPKSKLLIPPKKGGGTVAIHASFPDIFDDGHQMKYDGRMLKSGVYTADVGVVGLDSQFMSFNTTKVLVVTDGVTEYQTALHPDGTASRTFPAGVMATPWIFHTGTGGGGGGGSIDPVVIQEINRRLAALEAKPDPVGTFEGLTDTQVDVVTDVNGLIYLGEDGKLRGGAVNPMLAMGYTPVQAASVGFTSTVVTGNANAVVIAASPVVIMFAEANRTATLPNIVPFNTYKPSTTQIREGRLTYFVNPANMQKTLRVTSGQRFYKNGSMDTTNVVLPGKTTYVYNAAILDNGSGAMMECFVFMGQIAHEDSDMSSIMDGFTNLSNMHDAQQIEIDFIRTEQQHGKLTVEGLQNSMTDTTDRLVVVETTVTDVNSRMQGLEDRTDAGLADMVTRVDELDTKHDAQGVEIKAVDDKLDDFIAFGLAPLTNRVTISEGEITANKVRLDDLENKPHPSFFDLTNTPSSGQPGKVVGYNMAGDSLVSYDRVSSMTDLSDTPNSLTGNATKVMTVKTDESGFEFTDYPRLGPIENRLRIVEDGHDDQESRIETLELKDCPSEASLADGGTKVSSRSIASGSHFGSAHINAADMVHNDIISLTGSTARNAQFPEIVALSHTGPLASGQVRVGKELTLWGSGSANTTLKVHTGQSWLIDNITTTADITLASGIMETYKAIQQVGVFKWLRVNKSTSSNAAIGKDMSYKVDLMSTGNMQASMSAHSDVVVHNLGVNSNARVWLPVIQPVGTALGQDDVPLGRKLTVVNTGAQATKVAATVVSGQLLHFNDSLMVQNYDLPKDYSMDLFTHNYNGQLGWRVVRMGPIIHTDSGGGGGSDTFVGLTDTPSALEAKKLVTVNAAGTALEMSAASTDDLSGALSLAQGVVNGQALVNPNCMGSEIMETDLADVGGEHVVKTPVIIVGAWRNAHTIWLPLIDPYDANPLNSFGVRSGRLTTLYNGSGSGKNVVVKIDSRSTNTRMLGVDGYPITEFTIPPGYGVRFMPMYVASSTEVNKRRWVMLEKFNRMQA